jgi:hypothetical protein
MDEPATTDDKTGLNFFALFSFENYYNKNTSRYFQQVGVYGNDYEIAASVDFIPWQEYFSDGSIDDLLRVEGRLPNESRSTSC